MFQDIVLNILAPILVLILLGAVMRRKFAIDLGTLSKLNIYLFVPAFVFYNVANSTLDWSEMGGVVVITILQVATLGLIVWGIGIVFKIDHRTLAAIALAVMFYNSGNYGIPLAELAYPGTGNKSGGAVQAFVVLTQNVLNFTVGFVIAAWAGSGDFLKGMGQILRLPVLPTLAAALTARWWLQSSPDHHLPTVIRVTAKYLSDGMVPIALVTLGAQLAANPRWPRWRPVSLVLVLRLFFGPIQMAAMLWLLHRTGWRPVDLWPWPAELLILSAAVPTAVNTLLITMEVGGDAELAADCVFWTTVFSCVTIAVWLVVIRSAF